MHTIMITGGTGLLGTEILRQREFHAPTHEDFNILSNHSMESYFERMNYIPSRIIHCAALTKSKCGTLHDYNLVNYIGTKQLCLLCKRLNIQLIYISTDYVFDGAREFYKENENCNPIDDYSKTKLYGEIVALVLGMKVIRTSFSPRNYWPYKGAFTNKFSSFDKVDVIAGLIAKMVEHSSLWRGVLHVGTERKSFYDLAQKFNHKVEPMDVKDFPDIPIDTSLDTGKMRSIIERIG